MSIRSLVACHTPYFRLKSATQPSIQTSNLPHLSQPILVAGTSTLAKL